MNTELVYARVIRDFDNFLKKEKYLRGGQEKC